MIDSGVILAGGTGSRLFPVTKVTNKHFLNVYDKPMIYYSLSILLLLKIKKVTIVVDENSLNEAKNLLGDGTEFGIKIIYTIQKSPLGLPDAIMKTLKTDDTDKKFAVVLGDNFLYGREFYNNFYNLIDISKCNIFYQKVKNPEDFAVIEVNEGENKFNLVEKPKQYLSDLAVTGIYTFDNNFFKFFHEIKVSNRNEYEITDILNSYNKLDSLNPVYLGRGMTWLDMGSFDSLLYCANFVKTIQERQNILVNSPHEIAYRNGWITKKHVHALYKKNLNSMYFKNLYDSINSKY